MFCLFVCFCLFCFAVVSFCFCLLFCCCCCSGAYLIVMFSIWPVMMFYVSRQVGVLHDDDRWTAMLRDADRHCLQLLQEFGVVEKEEDRMIRASSRVVLIPPVKLRSPVRDTHCLELICSQIDRLSSNSHTKCDTLLFVPKRHNTTGAVQISKIVFDWF